MAPKKPAPDDENEAESFSDMMKGVKPLAQNKIDPDAASKSKAKFKSHHRQSGNHSHTDNHQTLGELEYVTPVGSDEVLAFVRGGIQDKLKTKLKKGLIPFEYKVDLHGATVNQAGKQLQIALDSAYESGIRCVLVVHGRGKGSFDNKPALKTHVNYWLRDLPQVLAFHSAQSRHGGTGALYVLLKRKKEK